MSGRKHFVEKRYSEFHALHKKVIISLYIADLFYSNCFPPLEIVKVYGLS